MILFSKANLAIDVSEILYFTKQGHAVVFIDKDRKIDLAWGSTTELYSINQIFKCLDYPKEMWDGVVNLCEVMNNYVLKSSCTSCKLDMIRITERKIKNIFNVGGIVDK